MKLKDCLQKGKVGAFPTTHIRGPHVDKEHFGDGEREESRFAFKVLKETKTNKLLYDRKMKHSKILHLVFASTFTTVRSLNVKHKRWDIGTA